MSAEADRYARLHAIVSAALDREVGADRDAWLAQACGDDRPLHAEVIALLAAGEQSAECGAFADAQLVDVRASLESVADHAASTWRPEEIGNYKIIRRLGEGGMGIVYEARQQSPQRSVAIKLLHPIQATPQRLSRFRHEAELLGRLQHPGIVQVFEAGMYDVGRGPQPFFAMELVDGVDIRAHCDRHGLDRAARIELLAQVCDAVQYAHEHGVVHRDLKPDNLLIGPLGQPRILDFGIARAVDSTTALTLLTQQGQLVGTLAYMAPEQFNPAVQNVTPLVDVYALGAVGFELLVGRLPHIIDDLGITKAIALLTTGDPPRAGSIDSALKGDVETILGKAIASEPERRYASAAALAGDLRRHLAHRPIQARPPSRTYLVRKFTRRHRGLVAGALATLLTLIAGTVVALGFALQSDRNAGLAAENENRAINGLHQSAQILIDAGRERDAVTQLRFVPEAARGLAWRLLDRAVPFVVDEEVGEWSFIDDEHLVGVRRGRVLVYSLSEHRVVRELFAGLGIDRLSRVASCGVASAYTADEANAPLEVLLVDLERETVLERSPAYMAHAEVAAASGFADDNLRWPQVSDDGRTVLWYTSVSTAELRVDGQVVRTIDGLTPHEAALLGPDGRLLAINRLSEVRVVDVAGASLLFRHACDSERGVAGLPVRGGVLLTSPRGAKRDEEPRYFRRFALEGVGGTVEPTDPFASGYATAPGPHLYWYPRDGRFVAVRHATGGVPGGYLASTVTGEPLRFGALETSAGGVGGFLPFDESTSCDVAVSPSGHRLAIHGAWGQARIVELDPRDNDPDFDQRVVTLRGHTNAAGRPGSGWIYHLAVSNDGSLIASAAPADPLIRIWDARTGDNVATLERNSSMLRDTIPGTWDAIMAFAPGDDRLILTTPYGQQGLCLLDWNLITGQVTLPAEPLPLQASHLELLDRFVETLAPAATARLSQRVQMQNGEALVAFMSPTPGLAVKLPPEGQHWRYVPGVEGAGVGVAVHPSLPRAAIVQRVDGGVSRAGHLVVVDTRSGQVLIRLELAFSPWCVAYGPDGSVLAVGTHEGSVLLFETERHTQQLEWRAHAGARYSYIYSIAWTPDGTRLVTVSGDETVRIWDTRTRVESRTEFERWRQLRTEMAACDDLSATFDGIAAEAARIERIRRAHRR